MTHRTLALLAALAAACSGEVGETALTEPVASAPQEIPSVYSVYGLPGPWWREGALPDDFDSDSRSCRARSTAARAGAEDAADAAYRGFLHCMQARGWARGSPPPS